MSEAKHTPTPWQYVPSNEHHGPYVTGPHGGDICDCYVMSKPSELSTLNGGPSRPIPFFGEMADANAALICRAVNCHAELVAALEELLACPDIADNDYKDEETHAAERRARAILARAKVQP